MLHCPTCGKDYAPDVRVCPEDKSPLLADATVGGESSRDPLIGHTLDDKYRLEEKLGIGGMGTVYRAKHLLIDRPVAIKVLNQRLVEDEAAQIRFRREARAAGRLQHVNAVTVTDFGRTSDGYVYLVMELLEGRTLRDVLAKEGPLDTARAVSLMMQVSAAVAAAHEAGIIHRDLKPANIFIERRAESPAVVKVLDFGIAKLAADTLDEEDAKNLTMVGVMIGTPRYMSPEQCDGLELTPAADVYSLGVILYEMLTGSVPFSGTSPLAIAVKHASEQPLSPRELVPSIPPELERVVLHALEKRPQDRPADAAEFRRELFATAELLGLEHAAVTSGPDIEALRTVGTESPSGRLIIDLSRLRENRAATTSGSEMTVVSDAHPQTSRERTEAGTAAHPFSRIGVSLTSSRRTHNLLALAVGVALALAVGATFFAFRTETDVPANLNVAATPTPTVNSSPSPTPTSSAVPAAKKEEKRRTENTNNTNNNKNEESKLGSILKKAGRIFKKPFKH